MAALNQWDCEAKRIHTTEDVYQTLYSGGVADAWNPRCFTQNTRDEVRFVNGDGLIVGALAAEPGMKQQNYIFIKR